MPCSSENFPSPDPLWCSFQCTPSHHPPTTPLTFPASVIADKALLYFATRTKTSSILKIASNFWLIKQ